MEMKMYILKWFPRWPWLADAIALCICTTVHSLAAQETLEHISWLSMNACLHKMVNSSPYYSHFRISS